MALTKRFAKLAQITPFLPVFGQGETKFQPIYAGDAASLIALLAPASGDRNLRVHGIIETGGLESISSLFFLDNLL